MSDVSGAPLYGTSITWTVKLANANGTINADLKTGYTVFDKAGAYVNALPTTVNDASEGHVYILQYQAVAGASPIKSAEVTIGTAVDYVTAASVKVVAKPYDADKKEGYLALIGENVSTTAGNYVATGVSFETKKEVPLTINSIDIVDAGLKVAATNTNVYAYVTYVDENGVSDSRRVKVENFAGVANVTKTGNAFEITVKGEKATSVVAGSYNFSDFRVAADSYKQNGSVAAPAVVSLQKNSETAITGGSLTVAENDTITVTVSYIGYSTTDQKVEEIKETVSISVTAAPTVTP